MKEKLEKKKKWNESRLENMGEKKKKRKMILINKKHIRKERLKSWYIFQLNFVKMIMRFLNLINFYENNKI